MYVSVVSVKESIGANSELICSEITDEQIEQIITDQSAYIDSYISSVTSVPVTDNEVIRRICKSLSVYEIHKQVSLVDIPDHINNEYRHVNGLLNKILKREIVIGTESLAIDFVAEEQFFKGFF